MDVGIISYIYVQIFPSLGETQRCHKSVTRAQLVRGEGQLHILLESMPRRAPKLQNKLRKKSFSKTSFHLRVAGAEKRTETRQR